METDQGKLAAIGTAGWLQNETQVSRWSQVTGGEVCAHLVDRWRMARLTSLSSF